MIVCMTFNDCNICSGLVTLINFIFVIPINYAEYIKRKKSKRQKEIRSGKGKKRIFSRSINKKIILPLILIFGRIIQFL